MDYSASSIDHKRFLFSAWLKLSLAVLVCLFTVNSLETNALSQENIRIKRLSTDEGLAAGFVSDIVRDPDGFMWFAGANALVRYDGYEFKHYHHQQDEPSSIDSSMIWHLLVDDSGVLWVRTSTGINRYNADVDNFTAVQRWDGITIHTVIQSSSDELLVATEKGIARVNKASMSLEIIDSTRELGDVSAFIESRDGKFWFASISKGLMLWDMDKGLIKKFKKGKGEPNAIIDSRALELYEDTVGHLWVGSYGGLSRLSLHSGAIVNYFNDADDPRSIGANVIADIHEDSDGMLWFATDGGGLNLYNPDSDSFTQIKHDAFNPQSLSSNIIKKIYEDEAGDLWFGMFPSGVGHLNRLTTVFSTYKNNPIKPYSLSNNNAGTVTEDEFGNLWIGTGAGLNYFDRKKQQFFHIGNAPKDPGSLGEGAIMKVFYDSRNRLWAAVWAGGLHRLDSGADEFSTYLPTQNDTSTIPHHNIWGMMEDHKKRMWFGSESGLSMYDESTDTFINYHHSDNNPNGLVANFVWVIVEDHENKLWVGTTGGLSKFDPVTGEFKNYRVDDGDGALSHAGVVAILEDSKKRVWAGTQGGGLNLYDRKTDRFRQYTAGDGLASDFVQGILEDNEGYLWISGPSGITRFDPEKEKFVQFSKENGLQGNEFSFCALKAQNGELIFGGRDGFNIIDPSKVALNTQVPQIQFTNLSIANKSVELNAPDSPLSKSISKTREVTLNYDQSIFSFEYSALSFRNPHKNKYAYQLVGFDKNWHYVGSKRSATYTNLNPGDYIFKVKAANDEGVWGSSVQEMHLKVLPPWWRTWWAYTLYAIIIIGQIARILYVQYQKRRFAEAQNRILESKVAERTKELRQKNDDIQCMLSNMHQGLFTLETNLKIHHEYADYLESIFETDDIAGQDVMDFLLSKSALGNDHRMQIYIALDSMLGEDRINYEFNRHFLPRELVLVVNDKEKLLSLDWDPIMQGDITSKIMIAVRDVTQIREMEKEAERKERELKIISQLLNISNEKFQLFKKSYVSLLDENKTNICSKAQVSKNILAALFRNLHTIKGNARTLGLTYLSDIAHQIETYYDELRKKDTALYNADKLYDGVEQLENAIQEYDSIFEKIFARNQADEGRRSRNGLWLDSSYVMNLLKYVKRNDFISANDLLNSSRVKSNNQGIWLDEKSLSELQLSISERAPAKVEALLTDEYSEPLEKLLADNISSLKLVSEELGKPAPFVAFNCDDLLVKSTASEFMVSIFSHLLVNAIDHGIETPEERTLKGKDPRGMIDIESKRQGDKVSIAVSDDGRGINISKLFQKGVELGIWCDSDEPSMQDIANLIFHSGASTKGEVTDISGRGVGMDSVKNFVEQYGGNIELMIDESPASQDDYIKFETHIQMPTELFLIHNNSAEDSHKLV